MVKDLVELGQITTWADATEQAINQIGGAGATRQDIMNMARELDAEQNASSVGKVAVFSICRWAD